MEFKVVLTSRVQMDFKNITHHLLYELRSEQAAISVINDMEHTIERLSYMAGGLKLCDDPRLRDLGYRTIHFKRHNYFMLYRIMKNYYNKSSHPKSSIFRITFVCNIPKIEVQKHSIVFNGGVKYGKFFGAG